MSVHRPARTHRILAVTVGLAAAAALSVSLAGPAAAKGGTEKAAGTVSFFNPPASTLPPSVCTAVQSFKHSTTVGVGDTAASVVSVDYQVKPCDSKQPVTVEVLIAQDSDPTNVLLDQVGAPLSGRTGTGVQLETWYRITLIVRDAATGQWLDGATALEIGHRPTGV